MRMLLLLLRPLVGGIAAACVVVLLATLRHENTPVSTADISSLDAPDAVGGNRSGEMRYAFASDRSGGPRIWGGSDTSILNFPFAVTLASRCTGVLVRPDTVLTAGHCCATDGRAPDGKRCLDNVVRAGTSHPYAPYGLERRVVAACVMPCYEAYADGSSRCDVSVLTLSAPYPLGPTIRVARLATAERWAQGQMTPGHLVSVVGWGKTKTHARAPVVQVVTQWIASTCDRGEGSVF
eukprot:TRINITY_DN56200_c0_g1_i1.p1 TRINITY_DN56200_c0_g1~~TRINITY_DN56200_c0_g1_i1.p1  ORF type:complete len:237 (-),score=37.61 TRINITY_DN56200_c0_g1_i1:5-715(-)